MPEVNFLAIFLSAVWSMILGFVWYGPMLFGKAWMKLVGVTKKDIDAQKDQMGKKYGMMFVASLVTAYVLANIVSFAGARSVEAGAQGGFFVWLGFVATTKFTDVLFNGRPVKLFYIDAGYQLVNLVGMGIVLALLR